MPELLSVPPSVAPVVSTSGISSLTVTVSLCAPGSMVKSTRISLPTLTTTFPRSNVLNPGNSTRTVYVPGISVGSLYSPASSVVTVRAGPLCVSIMLTVAPGRTAPVESLTLPRIRPKLPCPNSAREKSNRTRVVMSTHRVTPDFNATDVTVSSISNAPQDRGGSTAQSFRLSKVYGHRIREQTSAPICGVAGTPSASAARRACDRSQVYNTQTVTFHWTHPLLKFLPSEDRLIRESGIDGYA